MNCQTFSHNPCTQKPQQKRSVCSRLITLPFQPMGSYLPRNATPCCLNCGQQEQRGQFQFINPVHQPCSSTLFINYVQSVYNIRYHHAESCTKQQEILSAFSSCMRVRAYVCACVDACTLCMHACLYMCVLVQMS